MELYLPIAEIPINILWILLLGFVAGMLSGLFGIGGGFLMTPALIFMGISPAVAVASSANQIIASSFSGFLAHAKRHNVDYKMGFVMIFGGLIGSFFGISLFSFFRKLGQIDLVISLCYIFILGTIGLSMAIESFRTIANLRSPKTTNNDSKTFLQKLPFKIYFPRSKITISILVPIFASIFAGILVSFMGIGGGFIMIPVMIYLIGMPTSVVIGTSLFQIIFVTCNVTFLHAINSYSVDIVLVFILLITSVIGAQYGTRLGVKIPAEKLRFLLAVLILAVVGKLLSSFFITPENIYQIIPFSYMQ
jgi:uncharacterized protein